MQNQSNFVELLPVDKFIKYEYSKWQWHITSNFFTFLKHHLHIKTKKNANDSSYHRFGTTS